MLVNAFHLYSVRPSAFSDAEEIRTLSSLQMVCMAASSAVIWLEQNFWRSSHHCKSFITLRYFCVVSPSYVCRISKPKNTPSVTAESPLSGIFPNRAEELFISLVPPCLRVPMPFSILTLGHHPATFFFFLTNSHLLIPTPLYNSLWLRFLLQLSK